MNPPADVTRLHDLPVPLSTNVTSDVDVRTLIPGGADIERPVPFANDEWDLAGHGTWKQKGGSATKIRFAAVPTMWRAAVKEWALLQLDPSLALTFAPEDPIAAAWPETQEPALPVTVQGNVKQLAFALRVLDDHGLHEPDDDGWARVAVLMRQPADRAEKRAGIQLASGTLRGRAQQLISLWSARTILHMPTLLGAEPFGGVPSTQLFGSGHRPKQNMRRPHEDVGRCLGFAAWFFDHIADDVIAHSRWWVENTTATSDAPSTRDEGYEAMVELLHDIVDDTEALPATVNASGSLTLAHVPLARLLGCDDADEAYLWGRYAMRRFDPAQLDLDGGSPCPLPITHMSKVDGSGTLPWAPRLLNTRRELHFWQSALVYYAMFYLAATCGLRDMDLTTLPRDCLSSSTETRPDGVAVERFTLSGYLTKGRRAPRKTQWPVNARIARVVTAVQQLHKILAVAPTRHEQTGEWLLFDAQLVTSSKRPSRSTMHLDLSYMDWFTKGARRLADRGVIADPLEDVVRLNSSQIRITAIQAYASRPLGNALAAQFGKWNHSAVALGYHGDVYKVVALAEPEAAADYAREDIGRTLLRTTDDDVRGAGVARLSRVVERELGDVANEGPLSTSRLKAIGRRNPNIAVGPFTICVYNAEGALCGGAGAADFRLCRPFECRNSAMTTAQRARFELRRRVEASTSPALIRSSEKLAAAAPDIVAEFADHSDHDLSRIIAEDLDDYLAAALGLGD